MTPSDITPARRPRRLRRVGLAAFAIGLVAAPIAAVGSDTDPDTEPTYTGCLDGTRADAGRVYAVAPGLSTLKPCEPGDTQLAVSGGDLTSIVAGVGIAATSGGFLGLSDAQGDVTLDLETAFRLPQGCSTGRPVVKAAPGWQCGNFPVVPARDRVVTGSSIIGENPAGANISDDWANISDPLEIPAGDWHITASALVNGSARCRLDAGGAVGLDHLESDTDLSSIVLQGVVSRSSAFTAVVACRDFGGGVRWRSLNIVAAEASGVTSRALDPHQ